MKRKLEYFWKNLIVGMFSVLFILTFVGIAESRAISLKAQDGYNISGDLQIPAAWHQGKVKLAAVLLHMYGADKESWRPLVQALSKKNICTLAIDMRGHGASRIGPHGKDGRKRVLAKDADFFNLMHLDALAAVSYLQKELGVDLQRLGFVGASVGCSVAIQTVVSLPTPVGAVVVLTPGKNYLGIDTMSHISKWSSQPLLILSSEEEQFRGAKQISEILANKGAELVLFDDEEIHGTHMFGAVDGVEVKIANWLHMKLVQIKLADH